MLPMEEGEDQCAIVAEMIAKHARSSTNECASAKAIATKPLVAEYTKTMVSSSHGSPVTLLLMAPQRPTTFSSP
jgi:hypothetical protein